MKTLVGLDHLKRLRNLGLRNNQIKKLRDISAVYGTLEKLDLYGNLIRRIDHVVDAGRLVHLDLSFNHLKTLMVSRVVRVPVESASGALSEGDARACDAACAHGHGTGAESADADDGDGGGGGGELNSSVDVHGAGGEGGSDGDEGEGDDDDDCGGDVGSHGDVGVVYEKQIVVDQESFLALLTSLHTLYLSNNRLDNCTGLAGVASTLQLLELGSNRLRDLSPLPAMPLLEELYLGRNRLTDVASAQFQLMPRLRVLALMSNRLQTCEGLRNVPNTLEELYLGHNGLHSVDGLQHLAQLRVLDLAGNQLKSLEGLCPLVSIEDLWCNDNEVPEWSEVDMLRVLPRLTCLYLERNPIWHPDRVPIYKEKVLTILPNLRQLDSEDLTMEPQYDVVRLALESLRRRAAGQPRGAPAVEASYGDDDGNGNEGEDDTAAKAPSR